MLCLHGGVFLALCKLVSFTETSPVNFEAWGISFLFCIWSKCTWGIAKIMAQPGIFQWFLEIVKKAINWVWTCCDFFHAKPQTYATGFQARWVFHWNQEKNSLVFISTFCTINLSLGRAVEWAHTSLFSFQFYRNGVNCTQLPSGSCGCWMHFLKTCDCLSFAHQK